MRGCLPAWDQGAAAKPDHLGLAYDSWAPIDVTGEHAGSVPPSIRSRWLQDLAKMKLDDDYCKYFELVQSSLHPHGTRNVKAASRLLIGHGYPSATEVGIEVHHTWGVPLIPGSALKGLTAHYVASVYGEEETDVSSLAAESRSKFRGVTRQGARMKSGPGSAFRDMFGAPDSEDGASAASGLVIFYDALLVPTSCCPVAVDVLTPHQSPYFGANGIAYPNDYDDPVPIQHLTIKPGTEFLIALGGPEDWVALAMHFALEALREWGVGGKTSSGYGRFQ